MTTPAPSAPRTFADQVSSIWHNAPEGAWIGAAIFAMYQCLMTFRFVDLGDINQTQVQDPRFWWALSLLVIVCLIARRRWPLPVIIVVNSVTLVSSLAGNPALYLMAGLIALYALIAHSLLPVCVAGIALTMAVDCISAYHQSLASDIPLSNYLLSSLGWVTVISVIAAFFRIRRFSLARRDAELAAEARQQELTRQRDAARRQAQVAAELHDSVGHDLTAIIALAEGISGASGNAEVDEAIATIQSLARDGLSDTRRAVSALQPDTGHSDTPAGPPGGDSALASWTGLAEVLATTRRTGLAVALSETGARPADPTTARIIFTVVREALTNVLRHAKEATRVVVSLDHTPLATSITITDDAPPAASRQSAAGGGHGLSNLADLVTEAGGTLQAGPGDNGWRLQALVPTR